MKRVVKKLALVALLVGAGFLVGKNQPNAASHLDGRLSACNDIIRNVGPAIALIPLKCEVYKGTVALTSEMAPDLHIDIVDGKKL